MDARDRLLELVSLLYAAPGRVEGWRTFLDRLCSAIDGTAASFISHDLRAHRGSIALSARTRPEVLRDYAARWNAEDPWATSPRSRRVPAGTIVTGDQLIEPALLRRTAYFNEFARRYDLVQCLAGVLEMDREAFSVLSINGGERRPRFGRDEAALLTALIPHLQQALRIHRRLSAAEQAAGDAQAALDRLTHGVFLVNARGRVIATNRMADDVLRARDGLWLERGELHASTQAGTTALRRALAAAIRTATAEGMGPGGVLIVRRPSGRPALNVLVAPIGARPPTLGAEPAAAIVFVTDPARTPAPGDDHLCAWFGLTVAEARVACLLLDGEGVGRVSERLCVSRNTVRTHLQRIFAKTNTKRQGELIRVLLSAMPSIRT